jgi:ribosomal RNA-processing protein 17
MPPPSKKRKLKESKTAEVIFDPSARFDYLTGFHKRKVQRTKKAQEAAAVKARQEKIDERKRV